jgi:tRNA nucleotidyltransferase (CCA-adding enzyme)
MRSSVETRFYQGILDRLEEDWIPDVYYTLAYGSQVPSCQVTKDMMSAVEPFLGDIVSELNQHRMQYVIDNILREREARREILIWTNPNARPVLIDGARVVQDGEYGYAVRPYTDRTDIMREVMENIEKLKDEQMKVPGKVYLVGGAVRDALLGIKSKDNDYVVVGSTAEEMEVQGFKPVGADFTVFLHPVTGDQYALARTDHKTSPGYKGFKFKSDPTITLEQDLARRDLTMNAMAVDDSDHIVDPFGGQQDIKDGLIRHVSEEAFKEDPVRVLRVARFHARYTDFHVHHKTMALCEEMAENGELDHLVPERVWMELAKGLMEKAPSKMIDTLWAVSALEVIIPELAALAGVPQPLEHHPEGDVLTHTLMALDLAAKWGAPIEERWAILLHDLGKGLTAPEILPSHHGHEQAGVSLVEAVCDRLKVPSACRELAVMVCREHTNIHRALELNASSIVHLFKRTDAFRRPERFKNMLRACEMDAKGRLGFHDREYPQVGHLLRALKAATSINAGEIAAKNTDKAYLAEQIHGARTRAIKAVLKS